MLARTPCLLSYLQSNPAEWMLFNSFFGDDRGTHHDGRPLMFVVFTGSTEPHL